MITILKDEEFKTAILNAIAGADREILIATYKMDYQDRLATRHLNAIVEALHRASKRYVKVSCLLNMDRENSTIGRINKRAKALLIKKGIITKTGPTGRTYHSKLIIVDECLVFIGSHNLTESSLCRNFEVSLMITDTKLAQELRQIYLKEWGKGK
ncbi:Cardiolipin synthase A [subsurface metagenome]